VDESAQVPQDGRVSLVWPNGIGGPDPAPRRISVLAVDDEPGLLRIVTRVLGEVSGYHVVTAGGGVEALQTFERERFDVVVADLMMPDIKGDEMVRRLRHRAPDVRVLYVTGFVDALFKDRPLLWDGEAFLEKPFRAEALLEAVAHLLSDCGSSSVDALPKGRHHRRAR
jgi:CheY-like chemotaxis protein